MTRKQLFAYAKRKYGGVAEYPWNDDNAVIRHKENKKWHALIMNVGCDKLKIEGEGNMDILNVKCDPVLIGSLRCQPGFLPAYHMNKEKWLTILLDRVDDKQIKSLIDLSYTLTEGKKK